VVDPISDRILEINLLKNVGFNFGEIDVAALQRIVDFLGNVKEIGPAPA
jgi:hypothetical protein